MLASKSVHCLRHWHPYTYFYASLPFYFVIVQWFSEIGLGVSSIPAHFIGQTILFDQVERLPSSLTVTILCGTEEASEMASLLNCMFYYC